MINIPFSPAFLLAKAASIDASQPKAELKMGYGGDQTHTEESIKKQFSQENHEYSKILLDLPRTFWKFGTEDTNFGFGKHQLISLPDITLHEDNLTKGVGIIIGYVRDKDGLCYVNVIDQIFERITISKEDLERFDIQLQPTPVARYLTTDQEKEISAITQHPERLSSLSENEITLFLAFANSTGNVDHSKHFLQRGFLGVVHLMGTTFLIELGLTKLVPQEPPLLLARNDTGDGLLITYSTKSETDVNLEYQYVIYKGEDQKFYAKINHNYQYEVSEQAWEQILKTAKENLYKANSLTDEDLFSLIPCLIDENFTRAFVEKLSKEANVSTVTRAKELINLCFEDPKHEQDRIRINAAIRGSDDALKEKVELLIEKCDKHQKYLSKYTDPTRVKQHAVVKELFLSLQNDETLTNYGKLQRFTKIFSDNHYILQKNTDSRGIRFLKTVGNILAGITILPAALMAIYKGTPKFWKSRADIFYSDAKTHNPVEENDFKFILSKEKLEDIITEGGIQNTFLNFMVTEHQFFAPGDGGWKQVKDDFVARTWLFNNKARLGQVIHDPNEISEAQIKEYLRELLNPPFNTEDYIDNFIAGMSQGPSYDLFNTMQGALTSGSLQIAQPTAKHEGYKINITQDPHNGHIYFHFYCNSVPIKDGHGITVGHLPGATESNYILTQKEINSELKWGFELLNFKTNNETVNAMFQGQILTVDELRHVMKPVDVVVNINDNLQYFIDQLKAKMDEISPNDLDSSASDDAQFIQTMRNFDILTLLKKSINEPINQNQKLINFSKNLEEIKLLLAEAPETHQDMKDAIDKLSNIPLPAYVAEALSSTTNTASSTPATTGSDKDPTSENSIPPSPSSESSEPEDAQSSASSTNEDMDNEDADTEPEILEEAEEAELPSSSPASIKSEAEAIASPVIPPLSKEGVLSGGPKKKSLQFSQPTITSEILSEKEVTQKLISTLEPDVLIMQLLGAANNTLEGNSEILVDYKDFMNLDSTNGLTIEKTINPATGDFELKYYLDRIPLQNSNGSPIGYIEGPTEFNFRISKNQIDASTGIESLGSTAQLVDIKTNSKAVYDMILNGPPSQDQLSRAMTPILPFHQLKTEWNNYVEKKINPSTEKSSGFRKLVRSKPKRPLTPVEQALKELSAILKSKTSDHDQFVNFSKAFNAKKEFLLQDADPTEISLIEMISYSASRPWKALDFSVAPHVHTVNKINEGDLELSRILNDVKPTEETLATINFLFEQAFKKFHKITDNEKKYAINEKLAQTRTREKGVDKFDPIFIFTHNGLTLAKKFENLLPSNSIQPLIALVQKICDLSFSTIYKINGDYQDDFETYIQNYFGESILKSLADQAWTTLSHKLVSAAATYLTSSPLIYGLASIDSESYSILSQILQNTSQALLSNYVQTKLPQANTVNSNTTNQTPIVEGTETIDLLPLESVFNNFLFKYQHLVVNLNNYGITLEMIAAPDIDFSHGSPVMLDEINAYREMIEGKIKAIIQDKFVDLEIPEFVTPLNQGTKTQSAIRTLVNTMNDIDETIDAIQQHYSPVVVAASSSSGLEPSAVAGSTEPTPSAASVSAGSSSSLHPHQAPPVLTQSPRDVSSIQPSENTSSLIQYEIIEHEGNHATKLKEVLNKLNLSSPDTENAGEIEARHPPSPSISSIVDDTHFRLGKIDGGAVIVERIHSQQLRSELVVLPDVLSPTHIWEKVIGETRLKGRDQFTVEFLKTLFVEINKHAKGKGREIKEKDISHFLSEANTPHPNDNARILFEAYNSLYQKAMYNDTFPSDEVIKIAREQIESRRNLDKTPIVITSAFSPAYVKAIMLYCQTKGYEVYNNSQFKDKKKTGIFAKNDGKISPKEIKDFERTLSRLGYDNEASHPTPLAEIGGPKKR